MDMFDLIKIWQQRRQTQEKMAKLMSLVTEAHGLLKSSKGPFLSSARDRLSRAEQAHEKAMRSFGQDDIENCESQLERALLNIQILQHHLSTKESEKHEIVLAEGSPEESVGRLSFAISSFKMAVESSNCKVSDLVKERLVEVVKVFDDAVELLENDQEEEAKSVSQSALLWLYLLGKEVEIDNQSGVVEINPILKSSSKAVRQIKGAIDDVAGAKRTINATRSAVPKKVQTRLDAAAEHLEDAIQALAEEDDDAVQKHITVVSMEAQMAEQLFEPGEAIAEYGAPAEEDAYAKRVFEMRQRIISMRRLLQRNAPNMERAVNKLEAVFTYYSKSIKALKAAESATERAGQKESLSEAERYAHSAVLDLDFARQILAAEGEPSYRDI